MISNNTDFNIMFSNNVIEYDTKSEQIQTVIGGNNVRYENNSISINANLEYFYLENYSGTFSQNEVTLNGNILGGIIGAYVQIGKMTILDNTFNINSKCKRYYSAKSIYRR